MHEPVRGLMQWSKGLFREITHLERSRFNGVTGLRSVIFVITPMIIGSATGYLFEALFVMLGANFLTDTEGTQPYATRLRILAAACLLEPVAFALGTLADTSGFLVIPLVGVGVFTVLMMRAYPR